MFIPVAGLTLVFPKVVIARKCQRTDQRDSEQVLLRGCRCIEIDVWNGDSRASSTEAEEKAQEKKHRFRPHFPRSLSPRQSKNPSDEISAAASCSEEGESLELPTPWKSASTAVRAEPRVLHGYTLTKEVSFRDVCVAIRDAAFVHRYDLDVVDAAAADS